MLHEEIFKLAESRIVRICSMYIAIDVPKMMHPTFKKAFKAELTWIKNNSKE